MKPPTKCREATGNLREPDYTLLRLSPMYQVDERRRRFETLVAEVHDPLTRYLRRRATFADADDVLSEVLLTVWTRLDDVPAGAELPWSYGAARRALANHRRGEQRRLQLVRRIEAQPPVTYDPLGAEGDPDLAAALASLNDSEREIIALWAWEGLETREIAAVLGTTPQRGEPAPRARQEEGFRKTPTESATCRTHRY